VLLLLLHLLEVRGDYPLHSQDGALRVLFLDLLETRPDHNRRWCLALGGSMDLQNPTTTRTVDNSSHPLRLVHLLYHNRNRQNLGIDPRIPREPKEFKQTIVLRQHMIQLVHHRRSRPNLGMDPRIPRETREFKETTVPRQHIRRLVHHRRNRQNLGIDPRILREPKAFKETTVLRQHIRRSRPNLGIIPREPKEFRETTVLRQHIRRLARHRRSRQNLGIDPRIPREPKEFKNTTLPRQHIIPLSTINLLNMAKFLISHHRHLVKIPTSNRRVGYLTMTIIRMKAFGV